MTLLREWLRGRKDGWDMGPDSCMIRQQFIPALQFHLLADHPSLQGSTHHRLTVAVRRLSATDLLLGEAGWSAG